MVTEEDFENILDYMSEISEFSMNLTSKQKRLDTDFLTVLNQNSWELYEKKEASAKEKFEVEFEHTAAKREYETISHQYQLTLDKYQNGE